MSRHSLRVRIRKTLLLLNLHSQGKTLLLKSNSFLPSFLVSLCLQLQSELLLRLLFLLSQDKGRMERARFKYRFFPGDFPCGRIGSFLNIKKYRRMTFFQSCKASCSRFICCKGSGIGFQSWFSI